VDDNPHMQKNPNVNFDHGNKGIPGFCGQGRKGRQFLIFLVVFWNESMVTMLSVGVQFFLEHIL